MQRSGTNEAHPTGAYRMTSIVQERNSENYPQHFAFGEVQFRDDRNELLGQVRSLTDKLSVAQAEIKQLKIKICDQNHSINNIKTQSKNDEEKWRSAYNLLARLLDNFKNNGKITQPNEKCDCEICVLHGSTPPSSTLKEIAKLGPVRYDPERPQPSKDDFYQEIGLMKKSDRSEFSRLKLLPNSHSSAYPNENIRKLSRRRFTKENRNDLTPKPASRYECGFIPSMTLNEDTQPTKSSPAKKRQFLTLKTKDDETRLTELSDVPPTKKIKIHVKQKMETNYRKKNREKNETDEIPDNSNVVLTARVKNSMIPNNVKRKMKTIKKSIANSLKGNRPVRTGRPPGRPQGSLTNMTEEKLIKKEKRTRLASKFELKNSKNGPKYHEAYTGTQVDGNKFQCFYCTKQYTVRQMVRFHTEDNHFTQAISKLEELWKLDKSIFKNMEEIPSLPD